jgi:hypothetical protein
MGKHQDSTFECNRALELVPWTSGQSWYLKTQPSEKVLAHMDVNDPPSPASFPPPPVSIRRASHEKPATLASSTGKPLMQEPGHSPEAVNSNLNFSRQLPDLDLIPQQLQPLRRYSIPAAQVRFRDAPEARHGGERFRRLSASPDLAKCSRQKIVDEMEGMLYGL